MQILIVSNFYPPSGFGGYEQWCHEVSHQLRLRGHDLLVLTSRYRSTCLSETDPSWVRRELYLEMDFGSLRNAFQFFAVRKKRENENLARLKRIIEDFSPDAVLIWGMWNITRSIPALVEKLLPGRVAYYMGDYWPTLPSQFENYWNDPPRNFITGFPKLLLKPIAQRMLAREERPELRMEHIIFPSRFLQHEFERMGISTKNPKIVYGAIDTKPYLDESVSSQTHDKISLLYIGRLIYDKGVHTAIEAVGHLVWKHGMTNLNLTVVGDGDPKYVSELRKLVEEKNIGTYVRFLPSQPKESLPILYRQFDILLFTSIWAEPFGRVIVEAMASGVVVVGTAVGGASEILAHDENALVFTPGDPESLGRQVKRLIDSPSLRKQLVEAGYRSAIDKFDIHRMTFDIEAYLKTLVNC